MSDKEKKDKVNTKIVELLMKEKTMKCLEGCGKEKEISENCLGCGNCGFWYCEDCHIEWNDENAARKQRVASVHPSGAWIMKFGCDRCNYCYQEIRCDLKLK